MDSARVGAGEQSRLGWTPAETIAQRRRGCSFSRVRVNGVIIHLRPDGRMGIITL